MDRLQFAVEGIRVGELPEFLEIADRLTREIVDLTTVGVGDLAGRRLGIRTQTGGPVDRRQTRNLERIGEHRDGRALDGCSAGCEQRRHRGDGEHEETGAVSAHRSTIVGPATVKMQRESPVSEWGDQYATALVPSPISKVSMTVLVTVLITVTEFTPGDGLWLPL